MKCAYNDKMLVISEGSCSYKPGKGKTPNNLKYNGLECNIIKSFFGKTKTDYLS